MTSNSVCASKLRTKTESISHSNNSSFNEEKLANNNAVIQNSRLQENFNCNKTSQLTCSVLPYEVTLHIFSYLDLESLARCAEVNYYWYQAVLDPFLYQNVVINSWECRKQIVSLEMLKKRSRHLRKFKYVFNKQKVINFSHYDEDFQKFDESRKLILTNTLLSFFQICCQKLTHLSLQYYLDDRILGQIGQCKHLTSLVLTDELGTSCSAFDNLLKLNKLVTLGLHKTSIDNNILKKILNANPNLKHLTLVKCKRIHCWNDILETIVRSNQRIKSINLFLDKPLSQRGATQISKCSNLEKLSISLAEPKYCRKSNVEALLAAMAYLKNLTHLYVSFTESVMTDFCKKALERLPKLQKLTLAGCIISDLSIKNLEKQYSNVKIILDLKGMFIGGRTRNSKEHQMEPVWDPIQFSSGSVDYIWGQCQPAWLLASTKRKNLFNNLDVTFLNKYI